HANDTSHVNQSSERKKRLPARLTRREEAQTNRLLRTPKKIDGGHTHRDTSPAPISGRDFFVSHESNIQQQQATNQELWVVDASQEDRTEEKKGGTNTFIYILYNPRCPCASDCCGALKTNRYILKEKINY
ncbi:unnamed protein product, partial [Ectocarpus sp. 8 AP-2014]